MVWQRRLTNNEKKYLCKMISHYFILKYWETKYPILSSLGATISQIFERLKTDIKNWFSNRIFSFYLKLGYLESSWPIWDTLEPGRLCVSIRTKLVSQLGLTRLWHGWKKFKSVNFPWSLLRSLAIFQNKDSFRKWSFQFREKSRFCTRSLFETKWKISVYFILIFE